MSLLRRQVPQVTYNAPFLRDSCEFFMPTGNGQDESGNSRDLTISGALADKDRFNDAGSSLKFDGNDYTYHDADWDGILGASFTLMGWCKIDDYSTVPSMMSIRSTSQSNSTNILTVRYFTTGGIQLLIRDNNSVNVNSFSEIHPTLGEWFFWAVTYNGSTQKLYYNGELVAEDSATYGAFVLERMTLGCAYDDDNNTYYRYLKGNVAMSRIFSRTLTAKEIQDAYFELSPEGKDLLESGLVAKYDMVGNAVDLSENTNDGAIVGALPDYNRFGDADSALTTNGTNGYISLPEYPRGTADFTIAFWFKLDNSGNICIIDGRAGGEGIWFSKPTDGLLYFAMDDGVHPAAITQSLEVPEIGKWTFVAGVRSEGNMKLFVNAQLQQVSSDNSIVIPLGTSLRLASNWTLDLFGICSYADFRIYNRALSRFEIECLYREFISPILSVYSYGTERVSIEEGVNSGGTYSELSDRIELSTVNANYIGLITTNKIDVTEYKKLNFICTTVITGDHVGMIGLGDSSTEWDVFDWVVSPDKSIVTVDISAVTGLKHIRAHNNRLTVSSGSITFSIYKIWLTK